jgi:hypothetical protein
MFKKSKIYQIVFKNKIYLVLILLNFFSIASLFSQAVGDFGNFATGNWGTTNTNWRLWDGFGFNNPALGAPTVNDNVWIKAGTTVTVEVSLKNCKNLTIQATGKLYTNSTTVNRFVNVFGNITCNGIIGNGVVTDGIGFNVEGVSCTLTGTGTFDASRIRKTAITNPITNFVIDMTINLRWVGNQLYNNTEATTVFTASQFNVTLNSGKTINMVGTTATTCIDGNSGLPNALPGALSQSGTFTINGTLNLDGLLILKAGNPAPGFCNWIIGSTGLIKTASVDAGASVGTGTHSFTINSSGKLLISGAAAFTAFSTSNNTYNLNSGSIVEYGAAGNQTVQNGLSYSHLNLSVSGNKTPTGNLTINRDLAISGAAKLIPLAAGLVSVGGNWTSYGVAGFTEGNSTVIFNGSVAQSIGGGVSESFYNLTVNNSFTGVSVNNLSYVINNLTLTAGNFNTSGLNRIAMNAGSSVVGGSNSSFVNGPIWKAGNTSFVFPTGKNGKYQPLSITAPLDINDAFEAQFFDQNPNAIYTGASTPALDHVSACDYWTLDRNAGVSDVNVNLSWQNNAAACVINDFPTLVVAKYNGSNWISQGNTATTGTFANGTVTSTAATIGSFTPFALGTLDNVLNPLPIELLYFEAIKKDKNSVALNWATATETNNDYFLIERAGTDVVFYPLETLNGSDNSTQTVTYNTIDRNPLSGQNYYRLKQIDNNGDFTYSEIRSVFYDGNSYGYEARLINNQIEVSFPNSYRGKLEILDGTGKLVFSRFVNEEKKVHYQPATNGLYLVRFLKEKNSTTIKLVY